MKLPLVIIAAALSLLTGLSSYERRAQINTSICELDKTLVTFLDSSLASVTLTEAAAFPDEYQRSYRQETTLARELVKQAPCRFTYQIPPNLLTR